MTAHEIRSDLLLRGITFRSLANLLNVSSCHVGRIARGEQQNHRIALAIAAALGKNVKDVFPDVPGYQKPYIAKDEHLRTLKAKLVDMKLIQQCA